MEVSIADIQMAVLEMNLALAAYNMADEDFEEAAWLEYKAKVARYEALLKSRKKENVHSEERIFQLIRQS